YVEVMAVPFCICHWILRDHATIVFDFDVQTERRQHLISQAQDFEQAIRREPVLGIFADMRLENNRISFAKLTSTINKPLRDITHFSHVGMSRDELLIRQHEPSETRAMLFKCSNQFSHSHMYDRSYIPI